MQIFVWGVLKMSAGITIYNDNGYLLINETYKNLALIAKIKVADKGYINQQNYRVINLAPYITEQVKVIAVSMDATISQLLNKPDGTYELQFTNSNGTIYLYGEIDATQTDKKYGLQVFDEKGNCVYDTNRDYMRVEKYCPDGERLLDIYGNNPNYAGAIGVNRFYLDGASEWGIFMSDYVFRRDGNEIYRDVFYFYTPISGSRHQNVGFMILNVTGQ